MEATDIEVVLHSVDSDKQRVDTRTAKLVCSFQ